MATPAQNINSFSEWEKIAWASIVVVCIIVCFWFLIYSIKLIRPHKKITLFAESHHKQLDWELAKLIGIRALTIAMATFSFCLSLIYACTEHWLLPSFTFGIRISVLIGAIYLLFQSLQSSTSAIHSHFTDKQDKVVPTKEPPEPKPEIKANDESSLVKPK